MYTEQTEGRFIVIRREGKNVIASVDTGCVVESNNGRYPLAFRFTHESTAEVMMRHFRDRMEKILSNIRRKAYEDGYKAGKQKQKKMAWFNDSFSDSSVTGY